MRFLLRTTGYSRAQLKRLVRRASTGERLIKRHTAPKPGFARKFTVADVALLAETDALHGTLSGPATRCLMQRAVAVFGDTRYEHLAGISVAQLYNLRRAAGCKVRQRHWTKTRGYSIPIAERRASAPDHRPGFIRIDSVRQGDQDGARGGLFYGLIPKWSSRIPPAIDGGCLWRIFSCCPRQTCTARTGLPAGRS